MSTVVLRTADGWWVRARDAAVRVDTAANTTAELLADRAAVRSAAEAAAEDGVPVESLDLVSPVTAPCRVVAQMTNYRSHVRESGMNPDTVPLAFFRKSSGSMCGPVDDVIKPAHVQLLDYEVEVGLVVGKTLEVGSIVDDSTVAEHIAALVIANDVSARDVQLPKTQFYESKSYPTFTPVGPALVLLEDGDLKRFEHLRLMLRVNGQVRQNSTVRDMIYRPTDALRALTRFQRVDPGDLILTGTPGGTALKAPPKPIEMIGALLPPAVKWKTFFRRQARNLSFLQDGDVMEATIATDDAMLDLGRQRTTVRFAR
ncbi:fumarylacetoacetate hydrolase family protein [Rhodococcoides corynebacterioides]|uniref:fumarylacetoacetate hydrolase family protein n=1 Tax=Rhodococcoides corynebacterioides TaxID=53972 RepID=UPI001C9A308A|nr:fumarylacetoacetate hydrolase family protein [Rhodococcus corynebacterioides]MBY6364601.1 fumarylacetoacetate hydrolase family protein [Rhodococcus corynebacterioides]